MERTWAAVTMPMVTTQLLAQSNPPVRLVLVVEIDETVAIADVLTPQLSWNSRIQLRERDEIKKCIGNASYTQPVPIPII